MLFATASAVVIIGAFAGLAASNPIFQMHSASEKISRSIPPTHRLHERHAPYWHQHWVKRDKVPSSAILPVRIGLKQTNLLAGHHKLMDISNPESPNYGKHMSAEEVVDFFAPHETSVNAIKNWLDTAGIESFRVGHSANKQWIQLDATVEEIENLIFAEYYVWEHSSGATDISSENYHVPKAVQDHIDYITPGARLRPAAKAARGEIRLSEVIGKRRLRNDGKAEQSAAAIVLPGLPNLNSSTCGSYVTADCVRAQYGIPVGKTAVVGNELGLFEGMDDHYSKADLDVYWSSLETEIPNGTYPEERLIDGAIGAYESPSVLPLGLNGESDLDFEIAFPLLWPQRPVLYQEDDQWYEIQQEIADDQDGVDIQFGFWNTFYDAIDGSYCTYSAYGETGDCTDPACMDPVYPDPNEGGFKGALQCGVYKPTNVISISYAFGENLLPAYYLKRQCSEIMKLGLQGVTVVASSGDGGVGGEENCPGKYHQIFHPLTPPSCPYVLGVGSTELDNVTMVAGTPLTEVPTTRFGSGGGFSNVFATPEYQTNAVKQYFDRVELNFTGYTEFVDGYDFSNVTSGVYHIGGRGIPDVSAVGDRYMMYWNGSWLTVGGTSVSAPIWGSLLTLINEERLIAGKSTLGFIHPILYAHPEVFNDITTGNNIACNLTYGYGFVAAKGWDPVSGLGSPNYSKLRTLLLDI